MKPAPGLKGRAWTAEDDERLKALIEAGVSMNLVAAKMKRTIQAVKWRANARGISTKRVWIRVESDEVRRGRKIWRWFAWFAGGLVVTVLCLGVAVWLGASAVLEYVMTVF
jgi:hypothetical protein